MFASHKHDEGGQMQKKLEKKIRYTQRISGTINIINDDRDLVKYLNKALKHTRVLFSVIFESKYNIINFCNLLNSDNLSEYSKELLEKIAETMKLIIEDLDDDAALIITSIDRLTQKYGLFTKEI